MKLILVFEEEVFAKRKWPFPKKNYYSHKRINDKKYEHVSSKERSYE